MPLEDLELALGELERGPAVVVGGGEGGAGPEEESHHGDVGGAGGQVQGGVPQPVRQVGVGPVSEENLHHGGVTLHTASSSQLSGTTPTLAEAKCRADRLSSS